MSERRLAICGELSRECLALLSPGDLAIEFETGLGGAWTELREGREVIRFGYPANSKSALFRPEAPPAKGHSIASQAIERILYARTIGAIYVLDDRFAETARRASAVYGGAVTLHVRTPEQTPAEFLAKPATETHP